MFLRPVRCVSWSQTRRVILQAAGSANYSDVRSCVVGARRCLTSCLLIITAIHSSSAPQLNLIPADKVTQFTVHYGEQNTAAVVRESSGFTAGNNK